MLISLTPNPRPSTPTRSLAGRPADWRARCVLARCASDLGPAVAGCPEAWAAQCAEHPQLVPQLLHHASEALAWSRQTACRLLGLFSSALDASQPSTQPSSRAAGGKAPIALDLAFLGLHTPQHSLASAQAARLVSTFLMCPGDEAVRKAAQSCVQALLRHLPTQGRAHLLGLLLAQVPQVLALGSDSKQLMSVTRAVLLSGSRPSSSTAGSAPAAATSWLSSHGAHHSGHSSGTGVHRHSGTGGHSASHTSTAHGSSHSHSHGSASSKHSSTAQPPLLQEADVARACALTAAALRESHRVVRNHPLSSVLGRLRQLVDVPGNYLEVGPREVLAPSPSSTPHQPPPLARIDSLKAEMRWEGGRGV